MTSPTVIPNILSDKKDLKKRLNFLKNSIDAHEPMLTAQEKEKMEEETKSKRIWELW